jgi:transposase
MDCFFEKLGEATFENLQSKFDDFLKKAESLKMDGTELLFGMEDVSAYGRTLAVFLMEHGKMVKHVNAILVARERKNQNVVQKTDAVDAECAARVLLSKFDTLPNADPQDKFWILRMLVVRRKHIVKNNTALKNHLHDLITTHYPNYELFFSTIDRISSLAFLKRHPSPQSLEGVTVEELADFLMDASGDHVGMEKAKKIMGIVRDNGYAPVQFQGVRDMAVRSTIRQLEFNTQELKRLDSELGEFLNLFDCTLTSMVGIDVVTAASILSCIGDIKKFPTSAKLARYSGIAPISYSSGKTDLQFANQRGNRELNSILYNLAVRISATVGCTNKAVNPFFYEYYHRKMSEGKTKRQSIKCVQRRLVNIIWTMLTNGEEYVNPPMFDIPKKKQQQQ